MDTPGNFSSLEERPSSHPCPGLLVEEAPRKTLLAYHGGRTHGRHLSLMYCGGGPRIDTPGLFWKRNPDSLGTDLSWRGNLVILVAGSSWRRDRIDAPGTDLSWKRDPDSLYWHWTCSSWSVSSDGHPWHWLILDMQPGWTSLVLAYLGQWNFIDTPSNDASLRDPKTIPEWFILRL